MPLTLTALSDLRALPFDTIIDVRSPAEFAEDHVPGAINLPVLSNEERAHVGTVYTQVDPFQARKIGAALVSRNAARHLEGPLADKDGAWRPLVYCWRGGQRSGSFAIILKQVGWRAETVAGGYKSYRRLVVSETYDTPLRHRFVLLDGNTGTAKTDFLKTLAARGHQVLDLEGLARHRGSLFGAMAEPQPSQKAFDSAIAWTLSGFDPARPVIAEAESSKIGDRLVPPSVWAAMGEAPRVRLSAPLEERARYLVRAYRDLIEQPDTLRTVIENLKQAHGSETVARWLAQVDEGAYEDLAHGLMTVHYDPRYAKWRQRNGTRMLDLRLERLDEEGIDLGAAKIERALATLDQGRPPIAPADQGPGSRQTDKKSMHHPSRSSGPKVQTA